MVKAAPLIVTLEMDSISLEYFTALRSKHFPAHANFLDAHITLFHNLPSEEKKVHEIIKQSANDLPMELTISGVKNIGNGVAFVVESDKLIKLHKGLQRSLKTWLVWQDAKKPWPHITVQNKVTAYKALQTTELLSKDFTPFTIKGIGVSTWLFMKGPWEKVEFYPFK